jgi:hypothetical protein
VALRPVGELQFGLARTDSTQMTVRSLCRAIATAACLLGASGCISNDGTPVFVDYAALDVWSGKGMLMEVSPDQTHCRVIVRDNYLIRRDRWVPCIHIHPRRDR